MFTKSQQLIINIFTDIINELIKKTKNDDTLELVMGYDRCIIYPTDDVHQKIFDIFMNCYKPELQVSIAIGYINIYTPDCNFITHEFTINFKQSTIKFFNYHNWRTTTLHTSHVFSPTMSEQQIDVLDGTHSLLTFENENTN